MNVAIVAPSPVPFTFGGVEGLVASLRDRIAALTAHQVELVKLPTPERGFWELIDSYRRFHALDLRHFDLVISCKYPAWLVQHPNHVCYMTHRLRGLYDCYHLTGAPADVRRGTPAVDALCAFMQRHHRSRADVLPDLFGLLERLREPGADLPPEHLSFPGPLIRRVIHFLDDHALAPRRIRRYAAISSVVAERPGYFPAGVRVGVVPPPSRLDGFKSTGADYLFTTSRLDSAKRIDLLIRAMRRTSTPLPLRIAGTGPQEAELRRLAQGDERIEFLGFVSDAQLIELYAGALGVLFVPYEEDYGLVTVEAMMSAKPVITCTDSGGTLELVTDGETGFVARPDPADLARQIERLTADVEQARKMGSLAHARVAEITWERTVQSLLGEPPDAGPSAGHATPGPRAAHGPGGAARPKLTVSVPFPVHPPVGGGQLRVFSLFKEVARTFDVELISLGDTAHDHWLAPGMREICIAKSPRHRTAEAQIARVAEGIPIGDIALALYHGYTPEYGAALAESMAAAAIVVASHPYTLPAIHACRPRVPLVYEAQDVESLLKEAVLGGRGPVSAELAEVVRDVEAESCRSASLVLACCAEDGRDLCRLYGIAPSRIHLTPNAVDTEVVRFVPPADRARRKAEAGLTGQSIAIFVGSWHPPNLEAAEAIFALAAALPSVTFLLVGSQCLALTSRPRARNVALLGVVDDVALLDLLGLADVALNPMRSGSGTNLKMATYLAAGVPVVSTPFGARGYDLTAGEHVVLAPIEHFPACISALLDDRALTERLAGAGRRLVEARYDWRVVAADLVRALQALVRIPARQTLIGDVVDRVSYEIAELGIPEHHPAILPVASAIGDLTVGAGPENATDEERA